jgi:hypothetical protein
MSEKDNRKIGVAFICFEDQLMNYSSNHRFSTPTSNWRALQQALQLGDYGGSFDPDYVITSIDSLIEMVHQKQLYENIDLDEIYKKHYGVIRGTELLKRLRDTAIAAQVAGTKVRAMIGAFVSDK